MFRHQAKKCKSKREDHKSYSLIAISALTSSESYQNKWYLDGGATSPMCSSIMYFTYLNKSYESIISADKKSIRADGKGSPIIKVKYFVTFIDDKFAKLSFTL